MRVVVPPVVVAARICRVVAPVQSLLEVEEWVGQWWAPSSVTLSEASIAPIASEELLREHGIPSDDWIATDSRPGQTEIEALIRTRDPERSPTMRFDEEVVTRAVPARRRKYPGNSRFRRHTPTSSDAQPADPERRKRKSTDAKTPRRRASDHPPRGASDDTT